MNENAGPEYLPDGVGAVGCTRCPGCNQVFGESLPIASFVPHHVNCTDPRNPTIATRLPLCSRCVFRWCEDDVFMDRCDRVGNEWLHMDSLLRKADADAIT